MEEGPLRGRGGRQERGEQKPGKRDLGWRRFLLAGRWVGGSLRKSLLCSPLESLAASGLLSNEEENLSTGCEEKAKAERGGQREANSGSDYVSQPPGDKCFLSAD